MERVVVVPAERMTSEPRLGRLPLALGYAGLLPQTIVVLLLLSGDLTARFVALALGFAYATLILSFLGGVWWGLGAAKPDRAPSWLWVAAVVPSLVGLVAAWPWAVGLAWPQPSLVLLGISLMLCLIVDKRLVSLGLAPKDWMRLRVPLSLGLGALTLSTWFL